MYVWTVYIYIYIYNETKRKEFVDKLNTMIHLNNNQENRFMRYRNVKPLLAYKIGFSGTFNAPILQRSTFRPRLESVQSCC